MVDSFVGSFGGTVSLGMEYRRYFQLDASQGHKGSLEMGNEKFVVVRDYLQGEAIATIPMIKK